MFPNWQYHLLKLASRIVCLMPYPAVLLFGSLLGRLYYRVARRQRRRALAQIQECLKLSPQEAERIIRRLFVNVGRMFMEVMYTPALNREKVKKYVTVENRHYLTEALAQGNGVVFLTAHIGNWEWLGAALALDGFPMASVIKRQPNEQYTRILNEYRRLAGIEIFARGTTELVGAAKALKQGKILGFLADQDGGHDGVIAEFLGKMASTPRGAAVFAKRFGAPVVPTFIVRRPEGGHRIIVHPPLYFQDTGNEQADVVEFTIHLNRVIEDFIRRYPDQWLWFQKRWNTKIETVPSTTLTMAGEAV